MTGTVQSCAVQRPAAAWVLGLLAACSSSEVSVPISAENSDAAYLAWARIGPSGKIIETLTVPFRSATRISTDVGDVIFAVALSPNELVRPDGTPLTGSEIEALEFGTTSNCGRCLFPTNESPMVAYSGQACPIPKKFASVARRVTELGLSEEIPKDLNQAIAELRLVFPGECACTPPPDFKLRDFDVCPAFSPRETIMPTDALISRDGTVFGTGDAFWLMFPPNEEERFAEIRPAFGGIETAVPLADGRVLVSSQPRGPSVEVSEIKLISPDGTIAIPVGLPSNLARVGVHAGQDDYVELGGTIRLGSQLVPSGARCRFVGDEAQCTLSTVLRDDACPHTYEKTVIDRIIAFENGDALGWINGGYVFRAAGSESWSCVPGLDDFFEEIPEVGELRLPGDIQIAALGRRFFACAQVASNTGSGAYLFSGELPEALQTLPNGTVAPFTLNRERIEFLSGSSCGGLARSPEGDRVWFLPSGASEIWVLGPEAGLDGRISTSSVAPSAPGPFVKLSGTAGHFVAIDGRGVLYRKRKEDSVFTPLNQVPTRSRAAVATESGFVLYESDAAPVEVVMGPHCSGTTQSSLEVPYDGPVTAAAEVDGFRVVVGDRDGRLWVARFESSQGSARPVEAGSIASSVTKMVPMSPDRFVLLLANRTLSVLTFLGDDVSIEPIESSISWSTIAGSKGVVWAGAQNELARISAVSPREVRLESMLSTLESTAYLAVAAVRDPDGLPDFSAIGLTCPDTGRVFAFDNIDLKDYPNVIASGSAWLLDDECADGLALCSDHGFLGTETTIPANGERASAAFRSLLGFAGNSGTQGTVLAAQSGLRALPFGNVREWQESPAGYVAVGSDGRVALIVP